ncbi:MAG: aldo/keto reductase, partial [Desulfovibrio sp.]|nr:aldo/keto reductase [Desulfovibrio sp.]
MGLSHAYGPATEKSAAIRLIRDAFDAGYDFFDTAEVYTGHYADGSLSVNEEIAGATLRPIREKVIIATKGGIRLGENLTVTGNGAPEAFRKSLEQSLKRLGVETIDLYYQHRPDPAVSPEIVAETMKEFIKEGKIRFWGVSNCPREYIRRANAVCPMAAIQLRYSMLARWNEAFFPLLEELNIGFVAYSPLANGFLTVDGKSERKYAGNGDFRSVMAQYSPESQKKGTVLLDLINRLATEKNATPAQISLAWVLAQKQYIVPIPGSSKKERIDENAAAYFNEKEVGNAVKDSGLPREEIFITSKLWIQDYGYDEAKKGIEASLANLD